jgi:hypothetical protein
MALPLKQGDKGSQVRELQKLLRQRGYSVGVDSDFGTETCNAVRAFQTQNLDQHGQPLVIDGKVGPLTWWSLNNPKPDVQPVSAIDYTQVPPPKLGGSRIGRAALAAAIGELKAGACEVGGNNSGPWVKKYLAPAGLDEGNSWCASFVSWCYLQASGAGTNKMPFAYCPGARALLKEFRDNGWAQDPQSGYEPVPGDIVVWWRAQLSGWEGHVGLVHQVKDGMLYTIEGNRSPRVQGFSYVLSRMEKLLGYGHVREV